MKRKLLSLLLLMVFATSANILHAQIINTIAGNGVVGFTGDGVPAISTGLDRPWSVAVDAAGNLYIADQNDQRVRKVSTSGIITTVAGSGTPGYNGDGIAATSAQLFDPTGVAVDASGNLYIAEYSNHRIRKVNTAGIITTVAGNGTGGFTFDGIAAIASELFNPKGIAVDAAGNLFIADYRNTRIRKVNTSGIISTVAGNGSFGYGGDTGPATAATLFFPAAVAVDAAGSIYIADENNNVIRKVSGGIINTIAGNGFFGFTGDGVPAITTELNTPEGVAVDGAGNVYIADYTNQRVRKVNTSGIISTIAGTGAIGFFGDGSAATGAIFDQPSGVAVDINGNVFVTDQFNNRIREINSLPPITGTTGLCIGGTSTLSDAHGGGTWTSGNTAVATIGLGSGTVLGLSAGTSIITYNVSGGSVFTVITVNPFPTAGSISGPATVCTGATINLSDPAIGGVWSSGSANATVSGGVVTGISAGTATIIYTVSNSCGTAFATKVITVNSLSAGIITGATGVCAGSSIILSDAVIGGAWSASNTHAFVAGGTVFGFSAGTDTISYTVTGACGTVSATHVVTVSSFPTGSPIIGASAVCVGSGILLSDASTGGVWSSSNASATISPGGLVTGVFAGTDTISYTISNPCGTSVVTKVITVSFLSAGTITGPGSVCIGSAIGLSDAVAGGVWSASNGDATVTGGTVAGVSAGTDIISYTVTGGCGTAIATASVSVVAFPIVGSIIGLSNICAGSSTFFTDGAPGGVWASSNGRATITGGGLVSGISPGVDTISYTIANACGIAIAEVVITINPLPDAGTISGPDSVCTSSIITLTDGAPSGSWSASNANATVSPGGVVTGVTDGPVFISYSVSNACGSAAATKFIFVHSSPVVGGISGSSSVCVGSSIALSDGTPGGIWSSPGFSGLVSVGSATGIVTGLSTGTALISYAVANTCGTGIVTKTITVNPSLSPGTISGLTSVCVGAAISLTESVFGGTWSCSNAHASISTGGIVTGITAGVDTIYYNVTNACGSATARTIITINPAPLVAPITGTGALLCAGSSIHLSDAVSGGTWSSTDTFIAKVNGSGTVTGMVIGTDTIVYTVKNIAGCQASTQVAVNVGAAMPSAILLPSGSVTICNNNSVLVYVVASAPVTYQWMVNGSIIPGATTISYTAHTGGSYSVSISSAGCTEVLSGTTVLTGITPVISFTPPNTLSTGSFVTYEWYLDGKFIPGATTNSLHATSAGKYTVVVLDDNLCHDTSAVYNLAAAGVNNVSNDAAVRIYPNPATSTLSIDAPEQVNVSLFSIDGKLLTKKNKVNSIDVSNLANGMYLLMIYDDHDLLIKTAKFAKSE